MKRWAIHRGDIRSVAMDQFGTFDAVLCDPPYELSDDGKASAARVALEVLFPKDAKVEPDRASNDELPRLVAEILALSMGRLGPGPSATMPEIAVTLDDDATRRENDVEDTAEGAVGTSEADTRSHEESKPTKYLGCFLLECADSTAMLDALNRAGTCLLSRGIGIGTRVSLASLPSLLHVSGSISFGDENVRSIYDAFSTGVSAYTTAEDLAVTCSLSTGRGPHDRLATSSALTLLAALKLGGARLVRASSRAGRLPTKAQPHRISVVCDAADRALAFDLLTHDVNVTTRGFMGKEWDGSKVAFDVAVWQRIAAVLRPGAHLVAFGGTRTYHRMTCAIEDAGFEVRDCFTWLYGSGFPKSLDVSKAIDKAAGAVRDVVGPDRYSARRPNASSGVAHGELGAAPDATAPSTDLAKTWSGYGTALKPAWEPAVIARKPLDGTVAANVQAHGCGALAIDAGRIGGGSTRRTNTAEMGYSGGNLPPSYETGSDFGRWPANVLLDESAAAQLDEQSGERPGMSGGGKHASGYGGGMFGAIDSTHTARGDSGGASRFFYTAKVSTSERNDGLDDLPDLDARETTGRDDDAPGNGPRAGAGRGGTAKNPHPTMKPVALTEYLAKLLLPPRGIGRPRRILVPFAGVGSEVLGALRAGWDEIVGIELDPRYVKIARLRLSRVDTAHQEALFG